MSKMSRACEISTKVRRKVWARDGGCCIICGTPGAPNSHYIRRSHGGLGIERNVAVMCRRCHEEYDNGSGKYQEAIEHAFRDYLSSYYEDWNEADLYYDKYKWVRTHEAD